MGTLSGRQELVPRSSSLDNVNTSARKRRGRMFHRVMSGLEKDGDIRFLTLTSAAIDLNSRFQQDFRKLRMRLLRRKLLVDYIRCPEYTKTGLRHEHILFRGSYIDQAYVGKLWQEIHNSPIVDIRRVKKNKRRLAGDMAKYMLKENAGRYSYSWGWVRRGFVKRWEKLKAFGWEMGWCYATVLTKWRIAIKMDIDLLEVIPI